MDRIVVSGLSLRLPESDSAEAFWNNLLVGADLVSDTPRSWDPRDFGVPRSYGQLRTYEQFDNLFFDVHPKQAEKLDPQIRMLLEVAYEALLDAAVNPAELAGSRTGVFVGACGSDVMANHVNALDEMTGYEATGCAISMFANRLSYHFDLKGPSMSVDTACASSLTAFDLACKAIASGDCDHALVGGSSFVFHPLWSVGFGRLNMLSPDGRCKSFQEDADGFVRAEGVVVLVLTRESTARKKYARVLTTASNNDGFTREGITFPNVEAQKELLRRIYCGRDVEALHYIEAHGTGTPAGDPVELGAIDAVLFDELARSRPVHVGSVKSNMGHAEGASGLAGLAKVLLSMLHGMIPPNRHTDRPNPAIPALVEGRIRVVADVTPFDEGLASVSSFGFGGSNTSVLLERVPPSSAPASGPYPLPYSARTAASRDVLEAVLTQTPQLGPVSSLLTALHRVPLARHSHRGFMLRDADGAVLVHVRREASAYERRPVWLVFNGVGSQWNGMGDALADIPIARQVLDRCHQHLLRHHIDLWRILTSDDPSIFEDPTHIFVGVGSVQLAQLACLQALGVEVDGCFGHSAGELVCAFFDGVLDLEQVLDIAVHRGRALTGSPIGHGAMAAVETDLDTLRCELPDDLELACHNSEHSFTIAGPLASLEAFAVHMESLGSPVRVVDSAKVPFHSSYIRCAEPTFRRALERIIGSPRARSERWLSTSRDVATWTGADTADVQYFVDNLFEPVWFHRCLKQVPSNAVMIELGPRGMLRSQCKATLPDSEHVRLMRRGERDSRVLWDGLGHLHGLGVALDWAGLVPQLRADNPLVRVPGLVSWQHDRSWALPEVRIGRGGVQTDFIQDFVVDISEPDNSFVKDHIVHGNPIFPGVGYLHLVWLTLARWKREQPERIAMELQDIRFVRASIFRNTTAIRLTIKLDTLNEEFIVLERDQLVASGKVVSVGRVSLQGDDIDTDWVHEGTHLERADVYRLFVRTGIEYGNLFRGIAAVSRDRTRALVDRTHDWPTYFDAVLQLLFVGSPSEAIGLPRSIDTFRFDPTRVCAEQTRLPAVIDSTTGSVRSPCVEIEGVTIHSNYVPDVGHYALHTVSFEPYVDRRPFPAHVRDYLALCRDLVCHHLHRVLYQERLDDLGEIGHLERIRTSLGAQIGPRSIPWNEVAALRDHPNAHMLRLILHVFEHWQELVRDGMPIILSSEAHRAAYRDDLTSAHRQQIIDVMLELVVRNRGSDELRVLEVGAGTGALTSISLPYLARYNVTYEVSDLSAGYFPDLEAELHEYDAKTRYRVWDANTPMPVVGGYGLVLGSNALHTVRDIERTLHHVADGLVEGGFVLLEEMTGGFWYSVGIWGFIRDFWDITDERTCGMYLDRDGWVSAAERAGLALVMERVVGDTLSYLLFRKVPAATAQLEVVDVGDITEPGPFRTLQEALRTRGSETPLWLRAHTETLPGLDGFVRCLAQESTPVRGLQIDGPGTPPSEEIARVQRLDLISNVWREGQWGSYFRTGWSEAQRGAGGAHRNHELRVTTPGDLRTIRRVPDWTTVPGRANATVKCFPLNFKDVMLASGKITSSEHRPFGEPIGLEYAAVRDDGTRIMGLNLSGGGLTERITTDDELVWWRVPDELSLEAACTMPVAYATAYAGIVLRGRAEPGEHIFIHSGAGSVGQAAIRIALDLGLEVFTTVSTQAKASFLLERYPELTPEHILDSRTTAFKRALLERTSGRGVDIVLNSFSGEKLVKSLESLARYGRFVDISRYDAFHNRDLPMRSFLENISFTNVALDQIYRDAHPDVRRIHTWMASALASGEATPIHHAEAASVVDAMQQLLRGDTIGKLVVRMDACRRSIPTLDVFACRPDRTYLVTGGLGGLGLELCQWLVARGARDLVIATRSLQLTAYQQLKVDQLRSCGVAVEVTDADLGQPTVTRRLVEALEARCPVGGVFHLAMTLRDERFVDTTFEHFRLPIRVKLDIGRSLDAATRAFCSELEHFVAFCSVVTFYGNEGQSAYALGNSALERLMERRQRDGLPGLAIQWGAVADTGFVAHAGMEDTFSHLGMESMGLLALLDSLDSLLPCKAPVVSSHAPLRPRRAADGEEEPRDLVASVLQIMGFDAPTALSEDRTLGELGVDSLMVVEISQVCSRHYGLSLSPRQIRTLTLGDLRELGAPCPPRVGAPSEPLSIHEAMPALQSNRVCYYVDGMFLDPKASLSAMHRDPEVTCFTVPYHDGITDLDALAGVFRKHLDALPPTVEHVTLAGFSFGSIVASVLRQGVRPTGRRLVVKGFAVPRVVFDQSLYGELLPLAGRLGGEPVDSIDAALDRLIERPDHAEVRSAFLAAVRRVFGLPPDSRGLVPYLGMLRALRFLYINREQLVPRRYDEVIVFRSDRFSLDADVAATIGDEVREIDAPHRSSAVEL